MGWCSQTGFGFKGEGGSEKWDVDLKKKRGGVLKQGLVILKEGWWSEKLCGNLERG